MIISLLTARLLLQDIVNAPEARSGGSRLFGYLCYFIMNICFPKLQDEITKILLG